MSEVVERFLEAKETPPPQRDAAWSLPLPQFASNTSKAIGDLRYFVTCSTRDARDAHWYWDVLIRLGLEGFVNMMQVEPPLTFLFWKCKLTHNHVAIDAPSRQADKRFCAYCYKPMPDEDTGFWDPVTRVYRY